MKLRYDLAVKVTPEMALKEAQANQHRYKAKPLFSQTGAGTLLSASTKDSAAEVARSTARIRKLMRAANKEWVQDHKEPRTLLETLDWLRSFHKKAPFFFFNGNTFSEIARTLTDALFAEFPRARRREAASLAAHYVAGVLDRESMCSGISALAQAADFQPGDSVRTLKGSTRGVVRRILPDGRIEWRPNGSKSDLVALPESLLRTETD